jgi:uroporphyrinogen-III synthase
MVKDLLILRNKTSLEHTKEFFSDKNIDFYYDNISISTPLNVNLNDLKIDIVLLTSKNALDSLNNNIQWFSFKKIYCLNNGLLKKVKVLNAVDLKWNNTKELADYIINNEDKSKKIVHLCADNANKLFYAKIKNAGFNIQAVNVYKTDFVDNLKEDIIEDLKNFKIKNIMIFSKASLKAMLNIFANNNIDYKNYNLICFSKNIAEGYSNIYSENSNLDEMFKLYLSLENSNG